MVLIQTHERTICRQASKVLRPNIFDRVAPYLNHGSVRLVIQQIQCQFDSLLAVILSLYQSTIANVKYVCHSVYPLRDPTELCGPQSRNLHREPTL